MAVFEKRLWSSFSGVGTPLSPPHVGKTWFWQLVQGVRDRGVFKRVCRPERFHPSDLDVFRFDRFGWSKYRVCPAGRARHRGRRSIPMASSQGSTSSSGG